MRFSRSIPQARANVSLAGIQQPNRYKMIWDWMPGVELYPFAVSLPGYGYDLIEHSIWSIIRKIPFRKTHTDLEVTFMMDNRNYYSYVKHWYTLMSDPKNSSLNSARMTGSANPRQQGNSPNTGFLRTQEQSNEWADRNQVSREETENGEPPDPNDPSSGGVGTVVVGNQNAVSDGGLMNDNNVIWTNQNVAGKLSGNGGAANYMTDIYPHSLQIILVDEQHNDRTTFVFDEAYVSQVSQVALTSAETGFTPFKVFFRFTTMQFK